MEALDAGADDYVTKPCGMAELLARINAALRRAGDGHVASDPEVTTPWMRLDLGAEPLGEMIRSSLLALASWWSEHPDVPREVPVAAMTRLCTAIGAGG